jgi:nitroreductase
METFEALAKRRACRDFSKEPVAREIIDKLLYAASRAPTACNMPYRHFIVVDDPRVIKSIRQLSASLLADPPILIIVVSDMKVAVEDTGPLAEFSAYVDSGAAGQNILLAAADLGLGSQFTMIPVMAGVREILDLPNNFRVDLIIPIGYPKKDWKGSVKAQRNANSVFHNRFGEKY